MKDRIFFSGLNELRAFAALAVVFHHIELYFLKLKDKVSPVSSGKL